VKEAWFPLMGEALMETMKVCLDASSFTPETEQAWKEVYHALSSTMVEAMNSEQQVLSSWAKLKAIKDYDLVAGTLLFRHLFRSCPEIKALFGFPIELDVDSNIMLQSRRFQLHAKYFIEMLDKALGMVESKQLESNMTHLGELHAGMGVQEGHFPLMAEALLFALSETLGEEDWTADVKAAWTNVFDGLSSQMIAAMKKSRASK
jgi:hemoglobin-like flavoprotein